MRSGLDAEIDLAILIQTPCHGRVGFRHDCLYNEFVRWPWPFALPHRQRNIAFFGVLHV